MKRIRICFLLSFVLLACFSNTAGAQSRSLCFTRLKCVHSQGDFFSDSIYIKYRINNGDIHRWPIGENLYFDSKDERTSLFNLRCNSGDCVYIELWDDDTFDSDDRLGSTTVIVGGQNEGIIEFDEDYQAYYLLNYRVTK